MKSTQVKCPPASGESSTEYASGVLTINSVIITDIADTAIKVIDGLFLRLNGFFARIIKIINVCERIPNVNQNDWKIVACSGVLIPSTKYRTTNDIISKMELKGP